MERTVFSVDIQPIARRIYEASVHSGVVDGSEAQDEGIILRVRLEVEPGLVIRTTVEPVKP